MSYDPTLPANNSPISSAELRAQLAGLKQLIDDVPTSAAMTDVLNTQTAGPMIGIPEPALTFSDPPTQAEVEALNDMVHQMFVLLTRT